MKYKYQESTFSALMLLVGLFLLAHTFADRYQSLLIEEDVLAPMFYPRMVLSGWCLMALLMAVNALRQAGNEHKAFDFKKVFLAMLLMLGMLGMLVCFGFVVAAVPFIFCFALFLGYRRKWWAGVAALAIPIILYLVFERGLGISMPTPIWQF